MITIQPLEHNLSMYCRIAGQTDRQPAYLILDPTDRVVWGAYDGEIGGAVPESVWCGRIRRYACPPLTVAGYQRITERLRPLMERVCSGYTEHTDDQMRQLGVLTDDARDAEDEIERILEDIDESDQPQIWHADDWLALSTPAELGLTPDMSDADIETLARELQDQAQLDGIHHVEDLEDVLIAIRDRLVEEREERGQS